MRKHEDDAFVEYICDQLARLDGITHRRMFGGYGLYCGATFFGIVYREKLYFKTSDETRKKYEGWDMPPFQPTAKQTLKSYYQVPPDYIDDAETLLELAEESVRVAAGR